MGYPRDVSTEHEAETIGRETKDGMSKSRRGGSWLQVEVETGRVGQVVEAPNHAETGTKPSRLKIGCSPGPRVASSGGKIEDGCARPKTGEQTK